MHVAHIEVCSRVYYSKDSCAGIGIRKREGRDGREGVELFLMPPGMIMDPLPRCQGAGGADLGDGAGG